MKRAIAILTVFMFMIASSISFTSCASTSTGNADYMAYTRTLQAQFVASQEPLVQIEVSVDGKIEGIVINQPVRPIRVEQKNPHPVWRVATGMVKMLGIVGSIWATGEALEGMLDAGTGDTNINSGNNNSGNEGSISQDYSTVDTVTTDNSAITNPDPIIEEETTTE